MDESLRQAIADGSVTEEQADAIRSQVQSGDYSGFDQLLKNVFPTACDVNVWLMEPEVIPGEGLSHQGYVDRIGAILNVDGRRVADAIDQAVKEMFLMDQEPVEPVEPAAAGAVAG